VHDNRCFVDTGCACSALFVISDVFDTSISCADDGKHGAAAEEVAVELTVPLLRHAGASLRFPHFFLPKIFGQRMQSKFLILLQLSNLLLPSLQLPLMRCFYVRAVVSLGFQAAGERACLRMGRALG
jgi:hypothetical protein